MKLTENSKDLPIYKIIRYIFLYMDESVSEYMSG